MPVGIIADYSQKWLDEGGQIYPFVNKTDGTAIWNAATNGIAQERSVLICPDRSQISFNYSATSESYENISSVLEGLGVNKVNATSIFTKKQLQKNLFYKIVNNKIIFNSSIKPSTINVLNLQGKTLNSISCNDNSVYSFNDLSKGIFILEIIYSKTIFKEITILK